LTTQLLSQSGGKKEQKGMLLQLGVFFDCHITKISLCSSLKCPFASSHFHEGFRAEPKFFHVFLPKSDRSPSHPVSGWLRTQPKSCLAARWVPATAMLQGVCIIASKSHALKIGSEQDTTSRRMQTRGGGRGFQPGLWFHRLGLIRSPKV